MAFEMKSSMHAPHMSSSIRTHRFTNREGLCLAGDIGGDPGAQPIVLLHGGGQTRHSWRHTLDELVSRGYHVISLDARGHGGSDWAADGDYQLETLGRDLLDVIGTLPKKPIIVGASMGGMTALFAVGLAREQAVRSVILVDVVPGLDPQGSQQIVDFLQGHMGGFDSLEQAADAISAYNPHRPRPKDISGLMKNLRSHGDGRLYWHWDPAFFTTSDLIEPLAFRDRLYEICTSITIPVLLVKGMYSNVVTDQGVQEFRQRLPQLQVFEVSGAGHMITGDRNDLFNEGVLKFIEEHVGAK